jgi:hypothetical protein
MAIADYEILETEKLRIFHFRNDEEGEIKSMCKISY